MATARSKSEIPVALNDSGVEVHAEQMGDLLVAFEKWPKGDWRPLFHGLPGNACEAEHWGFLLKGTARLTSKDGTLVIRAGQAYHAPPGHTFDVDEDAEMIEFTRPHATYDADVATILENFERMKARPSAAKR